jgi:hypothetical protein
MIQEFINEWRIVVHGGGPIVWCECVRLFFEEIVVVVVLVVVGYLCCFSRGKPDFTVERDRDIDATDQLPPLLLTGTLPPRGFVDFSVRIRLQ